MSETFDCSDAEQRAKGIASAVSAVKGGRLVVLPTDTVYGIGADAFDNTAVAALLSAKGRGRDMPVPVLVGSWHTIEGLVYTVPNAARELIRAFWPGALSLVVRQAPSLQWDLGDADGTVMLVLSDWAQRIVTFNPDASGLVHLAWPYKVHMVLGMTIFLLFPFSRLVHVWSGLASVFYALRPYQVVRSRRLNLPK